MSKHPMLRLVLVALLVAASVGIADSASAHTSRHKARSAEARGDTVTPIQHLVVIYQENVSYDHYFGTYPNAANTDGQSFFPAPGTPDANGLGSLLTSNPNSASPQRLDSSATGLAGSPGGQLTCDQNHNYSSEQKASDNGQMDRFPEAVGTGSGKAPTGQPCDRNLVMDYYDGNTVTALWNYAQHFSMSDNSYSTVYGPSSPGAIALVSGNTGNVDWDHRVNNPSIATSTSPNADVTPNGLGGYSLTSDAQPYWDDCSTRDAVAMQGTNIGDKLNAAGVSWGWFEGGFRPTKSFADAAAAVGQSGQPTSQFTPDEFKTAGFQAQVPHSSNQGICDAVHPVGVALGGDGSQGWGYKDDYIPHHEPFQYYASTANPHHLSIPTNGSGQDTLAGLQIIGHDTQSYKDGKPQFDTPNHQYDMSDWDQLVGAISDGNLPPSALPAVSFLKASGYEDGHAAYSDPADEQGFIAREINALERTPDWAHTAVVIAYDDSDGWYDHAFPGVQNPSLSPADNLTNTTFSGPTSGQCGSNPQPFTPLGGEQGRCGFGPRQPFLVVSPFAAQNHVDHNVSNQASIPNFVEYNWGVPGISGSADQLLASTDSAEGIPFDIAGLFDFSGPRAQRLVLDPSTGQPQGGAR